MLTFFKKLGFNVIILLNKRLRLIDKNTVFIDGGLGSQILSTITFWNLQESIGINNVKCNLNYFSGSFSRDNNTNVVLRDWKLDFYGITKESFSRFESHSKVVSHLRKFNVSTKVKYTSLQRKQNRLLYLDKFPVNINLLDKFYLSLPNFKIGEHYTVTHIRRGDFVDVASHIVPYSNYLNLVLKIRNILPNYLIFFSDSRIPEDFRNSVAKILNNKINTVYIDDPLLNECVIHDAMRMADILITGNSTFSFSAALLGKEGQIQFSPLKFEIGDQSSKDSNINYQSAGEFFLWD